MELVKKGRQNHLSSTLVLSFIQQLFGSLFHMHQRGIFHRDIKVRVIFNIFFLNFEQAYILLGAGNSYNN